MYLATKPTDSLSYFKFIISHHINIENKSMIYC